ncbi:MULTISPECIES: hypothetical protein [Cellulosimicrobium]|uniref:Uncharacterized protein n=1 Tax=Cellulosimicrobium sp. ES-005 TaxID=3163031 RepID=A0AAU8FYX1_9MICO|nr:hypothetical protein [Cellulosimicrobium cellulans]MCO7273606.1 hypothetical protein [Cellulosimicrobium cellulans]
MSENDEGTARHGAEERSTEAPPEDGHAPGRARTDRAGAAATEAIPGEVPADDPERDADDRFDAG